MEHSEDGESKIQYFSTTDYSGGEMYDYNSAQPQVSPVASTRPGIISFFCILGFLAGIAAFFISFTDAAGAVGDWYPPYLMLGAVAGTAGYIGVWNMKLWGLYLVTLMFAVGLIVSYTMDAWNPVSAVGSAIILLVMWLYSNKMN